MKTYLVTIICAVAAVSALRAEDFNTRRNIKPQSQPQANTVKPATTTVRSFHNTNLQGNNFHPNSVQNLNTQRSFQARHFNTTNTTNTANTVNTARFKTNTSANAKVFNANTNNTRFQRFNRTNTNVTNNTNVTVNNRFHRFKVQNVQTNQPHITFHQGIGINGARNWSGPQYSAFRNYSAVWHDRDWWRAHHTNIIFVLGGWYYWDSGWWYPAWGYDPNAVFYFNGPIYGYNDLPPDQVVANVQSSLQAQGYYHGDIDGVMGPLTRAAIASYQQDHGLLVTSAIDQPTMASLGFA